MLSDLHSAEFLYSTHGLTLCFDSTTQEGIHINVISIHKGHDEYVLALDELAGGTAQDYSNHIFKTFQYLSNLYSEWYGLDGEEVKKKMTLNIVNTLTDRAIVNQAAIRLLNSEWESNINVLYCNLHPLDTIASSVKSCLVKLECKDERSLPSSGCLIDQIINHFNSPRFTDNLGDPRGFRINLVKNGLPKGLLKNARGNRLHLFFQQAEVHANHHETLMDYVKNKCAKKLDNTVKLVTDYSRPLAHAEFQTVGIMSRLLSAPWMSRFYRNPERSFTYVEAFKQVRHVIMRLTEIHENEELDVNAIHNDLFGDPINKSAQPDMWRVDPGSQVPAFLRALASTIKDVLVRQYRDMLSLNDEELEKLASETGNARVNNIGCEELVGLFSAIKERAPNGSLLFYSAKIKAKKTTLYNF